VQLAIASNTGAARNGTATIAGRTFTVNQAGACAYSVAPTTLAPAAAGGPERVDVSTTSGCAWTASTTTPWIGITAGASGDGNGRVDLSVAANTGPARSGSLTIAGRTVTVNQDSGCTYALNPTSAAMAASGGGKEVAVSATAGCTWTAVSPASWIVVSPPASGSGNGTVQLTIQANTTGAARMDTVTIAGIPFTVSQAR